MPTSFNDWKTVRETLSDIPLFLDREFILAIQKNIKICETRMLSLDPEAYNNYIEQKAKGPRRPPPRGSGDRSCPPVDLARPPKAGAISFPSA